MDNLLEHGLGWVTWQINKVIAFQTAEEVKKYIEDWLKAPKIFKFSGVTSNALITGSLLRLNFYCNDLVGEDPSPCEVVLETSQMGS